MIVSTSPPSPTVSSENRATLEANAQAYIRCVELEDLWHSKPEDIAEELSILRADFHALLLRALRHANIPFTDRADAARKAFELTSPTTTPL